MPALPGTQAAGPAGYKALALWAAWAPGSAGPAGTANLKLIPPNFRAKIWTSRAQWLMTFLQFPILNHRYIPILANHSSDVDSVVHSAGEI